MKTRLKIQYVNVICVSKPVPHTEEMWLLPTPMLDHVNGVNVITIFASNFVVFKHKFEKESEKPHLTSQDELNNLVQDLNLNNENMGKGFTWI